MKTVSFQGMSLSAAERRRLDFQARARAAQNTQLLSSCDEAIEAAAKLREQGIQVENPNKFRPESISRGTPFVGDAFGN